MKSSINLRAVLIGAVAALLFAATAEAGGLIPAVDARQQPPIDAAKQVMTVAPSGGTTTTKVEATPDTMRFWTNRAQRGTRAPNVGHAD